MVGVDNTSLLQGKHNVSTVHYAYIYIASMHLTLALRPATTTMMVVKGQDGKTPFPAPSL